MKFTIYHNVPFIKVEHTRPPSKLKAVLRLLWKVVRLTFTIRNRRYNLWNRKELLKASLRVLKRQGKVKTIKQKKISNNQNLCQ